MGFDTRSGHMGVVGGGWAAAQFLFLCETTHRSCTHSRSKKQPPAFTLTVLSKTPAAPKLISVGEGIVFLLLWHSRSCREEQLHPVCAPVLMCAKEEAMKGAAGIELKFKNCFFLVAHGPRRGIRKKRSRWQGREAAALWCDRPGPELGTQLSHTSLISPKTPVKYFFYWVAVFMKLNGKNRRELQSLSTSLTVLLQLRKHWASQLPQWGGSGWLHTGLTSLHQWEGCYLICPFTHHSYVMQDYSPFFEILEISGFKWHLQCLRAEPLKEVGTTRFQLKPQIVFPLY